MTFSVNGFNRSLIVIGSQRFMEKHFIGNFLVSDPYWDWLNLLTLLKTDGAG